MIRGIHHVAMSTPDLDRLLAFYSDLLGFEEVSRFEWPKGSGPVDAVLGLTETSGRQVMLKAANLCVEIFEFASPDPEPMDPNRPVCNHGHTHMCLDVADIHSVYQKLLAAGITFHAPPQDFEEVLATYGRDPDGNVFELQEIKQPDNPTQVLS